MTEMAAVGNFGRASSTWGSSYKNSRPLWDLTQLQRFAGDLKDKAAFESCPSERRLDTKPHSCENVGDSNTPLLPM